jgi:hypothetical protein
VIQPTVPGRNFFTTRHGFYYLRHKLSPVDPILYYSPLTHPAKLVILSINNSKALPFFCHKYSKEFFSYTAQIFLHTWACLHLYTAGRRIKLYSKHVVSIIRLSKGIQYMAVGSNLRGGRRCVAVCVPQHPDKIWVGFQK